jgi:hypothetical protein
VSFSTHVSNPYQIRFCARDDIQGAIDIILSVQCVHTHRRPAAVQSLQDSEFLNPLSEQHLPPCLIAQLYLGFPFFWVDTLAAVAHSKANRVSTVVDTPHTNHSVFDDRQGDRAQPVASPYAIL